MCRSKPALQNSLIQKQVEKYLHMWPASTGSTVRLINLSENHTFLISGPDGEKTVLRVHRPGYHGEAEIRSELDWMMALRSQAGMKTPRPIAGVNDDLVQTLPMDGNELAGNEFRHAVMFAFEEGTEPEEGKGLLPSFEQLGALAAHCHSHAQTWSLPSGFSRLNWDVSGILDRGAHWGDWRDAPNLDPGDARVLERAQEQLREFLAGYGKSRDRFGIIHADMRLANLLIDGGQVKLIDFDDCGFGWFAYDFAAAISFFEDSDHVPALFDSWLSGYQRVRKFSKKDIAAVDSMVMLRRFALLAWVGSHVETDLASGLAPDFASVSAQLAARYVKTGKLVS